MATPLFPLNVVFTGGPEHSSMTANFGEPSEPVEERKDYHVRAKTFNITTIPEFYVNVYQFAGTVFIEGGSMKISRPLLHLVCCARLEFDWDAHTIEIVVLEDNGHKE
jgi:hypothetical protein